MMEPNRGAPIHRQSHELNPVPLTQAQSQSGERSDVDAVLVNDPHASGSGGGGGGGGLWAHCSNSSLDIPCGLQFEAEDCHV